MNQQMLTELQNLYHPGNIAYYNSCEVTQIFLHRKNDSANFNFFTIAVLEESSRPAKPHEFLTDKLISVNDEYSFGIQRYWLDVEGIKNTFSELMNHNRWNFNGDTSLNLGNLLLLSKQFIPSKGENPINTILKNNFSNGSYIAEFFDETKEHVKVLLKKDSIQKLNEICEQIKQYVPIDLSVMRDRIGNIIVQFPINILNVQSKALPAWDGVDLTFAWDDRLANLPDCFIEVYSTFDNNYMGASIVDYNKSERQKVEIGSLDQLNHIKIWRKEPNLILSIFDGCFCKGLHLQIGIISPEPRIFELNGEKTEVQITSYDRDRKNKEKPEYNTYISNRLYDAETEKLEKSLEFKQYGKGKNQREEAINDLRELIRTHDRNGIYLWDPFLRPEDIITTLYFSVIANVPIKSIGSINDTIKTVYKKKGISINDIVSEYRAIFQNRNHNKYGLNLEFRCQYENYGWSFHDRFLMFPGDEYSRSKVYSLGTSINSLGKSHHIIQLVSHPQRVIDAFNELWNQLDKPECIVWKSTNT